MSRGPRLRIERTESLRIRISEYVEPFRVEVISMPLIFSSHTHLASENDRNRLLLTSMIQERERAKANHHISINQV
jgi:hypothetical protein